MGFSVLRIWPIFGSVFRFSHLKTAVLRFWCLVRFAGFHQFSLWFSVFDNNNNGGLSYFFCPMQFTVFRFCQGSYALQSRENGNSKGPFISLLPRLSFRGMHDISSRYLGCVVTAACQSDHEKTVSQISRSWDNTFY